MTTNTATRKADPDKPQSNGGSSAQTRLSVNINKTTEEALRSYAAEHDISVTEALRRLVSYGNLVVQADKDGKRVLFKEGNEVERLVLTD